MAGDSTTAETATSEFPDGFTLHISRLSSPAGSHATEVYGRERGEWPLQAVDEQPDRDGFIHIHEEMGWIRVSYMPFHHPLPLPDRDSTVYYAYTRDSVFGASPEELDDILPAYIHAPVEYTEFDRAESDAFHAIWHGTRHHRQPQGDPADNTFNPTKLLAGLEEIPDETWTTVEQYDALCDAADAGYEDEDTVREIVGDTFFEAAGTDERYYLVDD